ncbi:MAG: ATPase [Chloroflexales bacterium]|nr:ATPase [Chloroflexales bacterium]
MTHESVERSIVVPCIMARAFQIFTAELNRWWPRSHSRSGNPDITVTIEPWTGGRLYEQTPEGLEYEWGQVIAWDPPRHLAYHWYLGSSREQPSRVDVHFTDLGDSRTRVAVTHRGPELLGALWSRNSAIYDASWGVVLPAYGASCMTAEDV